MIVLTPSLSIFCSRKLDSQTKYACTPVTATILLTIISYDKAKYYDIVSGK